MTRSGVSDSRDIRYAMPRKPTFWIASERDVNVKSRTS